MLAHLLMFAQTGGEAVADHPVARFWINEVFAGSLAGFYALIPSLGLAIILLTLVVRVILLPLSIKQTRSMREMQRIQPEVKRLQQKHKGNRQKMNEELMALYKEHNVNPFGGCLPLLMQFPVLIALFYVIRAPLKYLGYSLPKGTAANAVVSGADYVRQEAAGLMRVLQDSSLADALRETGAAVYNFLGIRLDCSASGVLAQDGTGAAGACPHGIVILIPYILLVLLMGATTWYQQKQMTASRGAADDAQARQMQMFAKIMPLMLMVFSYSFPSGVVLYWLTTNLWTIGQQRLVLRAVPPHEPVPKKKPASEKKTRAASGGGDGRPKGSESERPNGDGAKQRARGGTANRKKRKR
jgi:YidC/Oxa1 family membrane protein insertase